MKLYAVCVTARPQIDGRMYPPRKMPVSKVAHLPAQNRAAFGYAPAVYTNKKVAEKMLKAMRKGYPHNAYDMIEFDSNAVEIPQ